MGSKADGYQTSDFASLKSEDRVIRSVVDVVIAKNFNHLDDYFQLHTVEVSDILVSIYELMLTETS